MVYGNKSMSRIMFLVPKLESGGIEQLAKQWYKKIEENGMKYSFVVLNEGGKSFDFFSNKGYEIFVLKPLAEVGVWGFAKQFYSLLIKEKFDIIHIPASRTSWIVLLLSWLAGCKKRIIHAHTNYYNATKGGDSGKIGLCIIRFLNNKFSTCRLAASVSAAKYCYGEKNDAIVIRNGIDLNKFTFSEQKRNEFRKKMGLEDCFIIGNVGRFTEQKNQKFCIDILSELKKNYSNDCKLLLMGEGKDESMLRDYARRNFLESDVLFGGTTDDLSGFYAAIDAFVFPSLFEGLGIVAVEAQCEGLMTYISEYVPEDSIVSTSVRRLSLSDGAQIWAKVIWENKNKRAYEAVSVVRESGFDEDETVEKIISTYLRELND